MKTKLKRTLLLAAALLGAVGCGGNDGSGGAATYVLFDHPVIVPAQFCTALNEGPVTVGNGSMNVRDRWSRRRDPDPGGDHLRLLLFRLLAEVPCDFPAGKAQLDVSSVGPQSGEIGVVADAYDFVVTCGNADADCAFDLTWSATY